jgi:argininosuccinate synthase
LIKFAESQDQIPKDKRGEAPFSVDANLLHSSSEGKSGRPGEEAPETFQRTLDPEEAPDEAEYIEIGLKRAMPVALNGEALSPGDLDRSSTTMAATRHWPPRPRRKPLCRHEIARHL